MTSNNSDRSVIKSSQGLQLGIDDCEDDHRRGQSPPPPQNIGDISISDSAEIHIGHNITYKAPVNITQHVYTGDERIDARRDFFSLSGISIGHWSRRKKAWSICLAALTMIVVVVVVVCVGSLPATGTSKFPPWNNDSSTNNNDSEPPLFVQRSQWYAEAARSPPRPLAALPAILAIISHTAGSPCHDLETCAKIVLNIQQHHKYGNGRWSDIGYNFLVGGDGLVYVGRGWGVEGAHTLGYNAWSLGIALVGKFDEIEPAEAQLEATRRLLERAVERGHLARNYTLLGQRQCRQTQSPGKAAYGIIKGWPHWSLLPPILAQTTTTTTV